GSQWHVPIYLDGRAGRFSGHLTTGYASTRGDLDGDSSRSLSGLLDTQIGGAYLLPGWIGWDWMVGVDMNLPTGRTGRDEREIRIMIDPDLVDIVSPGQGFNVNPYIGAARQWRQWVLGLGMGYAFQGSYDYSDQTRDYDPGDILSLAGQLTYLFTDAWRLNVQGQYAAVGTDQVNGNDLMQRGDSWLLKAAVLRATEQWDMALSVQTILRGKARISDAGGGGISTEARNSQGQEWIVDLLGGYRISPRTGINGGFQFLYLRSNDYDASSPLFMGRRQKYTLSLGMTQQLTDALELGVGLKGFIMDDDPNWLHPNQDREYKGWSATAAITHRF
ncbi:MAG: transporter, partial [Desulfatitalea sp.]|nr:transporter [Desulfatitalea sp.]